MPLASLPVGWAGPLASLPSPSSSAIHLGPLQIRAYGLCIALGVLAAVWLSSKRWQARGGSAEDFPAIALWAVPAGVVGARAYHVATDWHRFDERPVEALYLWQGGLGIWGGIALGTVVGAWVARRRGLSIPVAMDVVAPALPLAQAIGRVGNWFNQEVFGRPTDLPWALRIDAEHRPDGYEASPTFHPTFAYEALWNLGLVAVLLVVERRFRLRPGGLFAAYVAGYTAARFFIEGVRIDEATMVGPLRINEVVSLVVFALAVAALVVRRGGAGAPAGPAPTMPAVSPRISPDDVAHVARLARLDLTPEEVERATEQLGAVLEHFADVEALDLDGVPAMTHPYPLTNVLREDVVRPSVSRHEVLAAAPASRDGRFQVPPILGEAP